MVYLGCRLTYVLKSRCIWLPWLLLMGVAWKPQYLVVDKMLYGDYLIWKCLCELVYHDYSWNFSCSKNTCHKNHKLPCSQCYHTIFNYWDAYLPKNQHELYSAKIVPAAIFLVSGSWTIYCCLCKLSRVNKFLSWKFSLYAWNQEFIIV